MSLRKAIPVGVFLLSLQAASVGLWGQDPGPMHLQAPNLFLGQSKEPSSLLVLPKGLTQITRNAQTKEGSDYRDQNGRWFLNPTNYRTPLFRYAQLNMGFGLGAGFDVSITLPNVWANREGTIGNVMRHG